MSEPRYSGLALQDYLEIAAYISRDNPQAAAKVIERIEAECREVMRHPEGGLRHESLSVKYRVRMVGSYLVIYEIDHEGPVITRILHGARDLAKLFPDPE